MAPAAQWLLENSPSGRRSLRLEPAIMLGDDGLYRSDPEPVGHVQNLLPEVTVPVCKSCNGGWMNELEGRAQPLLRPFLVDGQPIIASASQRADLAVWALKTFMTYALTKGSQTNPFSSADYACLRQDRTVPPGVRVWLFTAASRWSQVGLQLKSWTMAPAGSLPDEAADNSALGMLAVGGAVFILTKFPPELLQLSALMEPPRSKPATALRELTGHSWRALKLAPNLLGEDYMDALDQWWYQPDLQILPTPVGLTPHQVGEVSAMASGGIPRSALTRLLPDTPVDTAGAQQHVEETQSRAVQFREHGDPVGVALLMTRAGREHFYMGDHEGAAQLMAAAASEPGGGLEFDGEAAYRVAQCYWNLRDARCAEWYQRCLDLGVSIAGAKFGLVDGLTWRGDYADALELLQRIPATTRRDRGIVLAAGAALRFLVFDLGLSHQDRHDPSESDLAQVTLATIQTTDATSATLWQQLSDEDPRHGYQFARAWFGNSTDAWILGAAVVGAHDSEDAVVDYFTCALARSADLGVNGDVWLSNLADAGLPVELLQHALAKARKDEDWKGVRVLKLRRTFDRFLRTKRG